MAGFLRDAARLDVSLWTVVNVLKSWVDHGTPKAEINRALDGVHAQVAGRQRELVEHYRDGLHTLV
jgi:hypothetical protein